MLTNLTVEEDIEAFLGTFKRVTEQEGWWPLDWAQIFTPFLMGEAQQAYHTLHMAKEEDYSILKEETLASL